MVRRRQFCVEMVVDPQCDIDHGVVQCEKPVGNTMKNCFPPEGAMNGAVAIAPIVTANVPPTKKTLPLRISPLSSASADPAPHARLRRSLASVHANHNACIKVDYRPNSTMVSSQILCAIWMQGLLSCLAVPIAAARGARSSWPGRVLGSLQL